MASSLLDRALVALASRGLTRLRPRQLKRHRVFPLCKAEAQIPLVVFADPYRHASIVVKGHYTIEYRSAASYSTNPKGLCFTSAHQSKAARHRHSPAGSGCPFSLATRTAMEVRG